MTVTRIKTSFATSADLPTYEATAAEKAILAIPSLTGWFEARHGISEKSGFRWRDRASTRAAAALQLQVPLIVTGTNGELCLQTGYGNAAFNTGDRGALRTSSHHELLSATGFTVFSVTRVPTVASGDSATLGGSVWSSRGPTGDTLPGLNISGSTGRPTFRSGGATIANPEGFDARTGNWHIMRCVHDVAAATIAVNIDRTRAVGSNTGASTAPSGALANGLAPTIGALYNTTINGVATPFYGQTAAMLFFSGVLTAAQISTVEDYLSDEFGVTLV